MGMKRHEAERLIEKSFRLMPYGWLTTDTESCKNF
jgi:hypothetical protein